MAFYTKPRTRKIYRPFKKPSTTRRRPSYRSRFKKPGRFATNYRTYRKTKRISKSMTNFAETIYNPLTAVNEQAPIDQVGTTKTYYQGFTLGNSVPTGWTNYYALGSMSVAQGTGNNERTGQWAYIKKTTMHMSIDMKPNTSSANSQPTVFRVIVFKAKPGARQFGQTYTPDSTLMMNTSGQEIGVTSAGVTGADMMLQPLNRRRWTIYKDYKCTLSPPNELNGASNAFYPSRKEFMLNLPFWKKVRFNTSSEPQDIDFHYGVLILATNIGKFTDANRWETNIRGTTTFNDL